MGYQAEPNGCGCLWDHLLSDKSPTTECFYWSSGHHKPLSPFPNKENSLQEQLDHIQVHWVQQWPKNLLLLWQYHFSLVVLMELGFLVLSFLFYKSSNELNTYPLNLPLAIYFSTYSSHLQVFTSQLLFKDLPVLSNIIYFIKYYYFDKLLSQSFSSSYWKATTEYGIVTILLGIFGIALYLVCQTQHFTFRPKSSSLVSSDHKIFFQ